VAEGTQSEQKLRRKPCPRAHVGFFTRHGRPLSRALHEFNNTTYLVLNSFVKDDLLPSSFRLSRTPALNFDFDFALPFAFVPYN
jgi:hypothetical protein